LVSFGHLSTVKESVTLIMENEAIKMCNERSSINNWFQHVSFQRDAVTNMDGNERQHIESLSRRVSHNAIDSNNGSLDDLI